MTGTIEDRALFWFIHGDTGTSSICIAEHMLFATGKHRSSPRDSFDLGRCIALLDTIPEWRGRIREMESVSRYWAAIVPHWDELESTYEASGQRASEMLRKLLDDEQKRDYHERTRLALNRR